MAIAAIQSEFTNVVLVAKRYRLRPGNIHFRDIGRLVDDVHCVSQYCNQDHCAIDAYARNRIRAAMKYLSHTCIVGNFPTWTAWKTLPPLFEPRFAVRICGTQRTRPDEGELHSGNQPLHDYVISAERLRLF